jgi:hypothetical protein
MFQRPVRVPATDNESMTEGVETQSLSLAV